MTVDDVLREMEAARATLIVGGVDVTRWLEVLRPALAQRGLVTGWPGATEDPGSPVSIEVFPLKSGLPQRLLRDLGIKVELRADHEGTGEIRIDYSGAPHETRLQALLSIMGAVGDRIAYAIGEQAYIDLLRGVIERRERG